MPSCFMASSKWDARNYISLVVHNGNVLLFTECEISCYISFLLCDFTSHLGLHNRSIGPVTGVMVRPCV